MTNAQQGGNVAHIRERGSFVNQREAHLGHRPALLARKHDHLHQEFRRVSIHAKQTDLTLLA